MIMEFFADMMAKAMAPAIVKNIKEGISAYEDARFPMPVRCKARHWMKRGEERIDFKALLFEE
jgi:hypothetical protein